MKICVLCNRCNKGFGNLELHEPKDLQSAESLFRITKRASVTERDMCVYSINIPSIYGCPVGVDYKNGRSSISMTVINIFETLVGYSVMFLMIIVAIQLFRFRRNVSILVRIVAMRIVIFVGIDLI